MHSNHSIKFRMFNEIFTILSLIIDWFSFVPKHPIRHKILSIKVVVIYRSWCLRVTSFMLYTRHDKYYHWGGWEVIAPVNSTGLLVGPEWIKVPCKLYSTYIVKGLILLVDFNYWLYFLDQILNVWIGRGDIRCNSLWHHLFKMNET